MTDIFFPVVERPIDVRCRDDRHTSIHTHKAICRPDGFSKDPLVLGVVGSAYKIVLNVELFGAVEKAINEVVPSKYLAGAKIKDKVANHGAFCMREYIFPNFKVEIDQSAKSGGRINTEIGYRTILWNTYDGSGAAKLVTGAIDFFCTNGMISGDYDVFKRRHTSGFNVPDFRETVEKNIKSFQAATEEWQEWAKMDITRAKAAEVLKNLPNLSDSRAEKLLIQYNREAYERGQTVWALYSAMTHYASHNSGNFNIRNTGIDHEAQTMQRREEQVLIWVRSKVWKEMVNK